MFYPIKRKWFILDKKLGGPQNRFVVKTYNRENYYKAQRAATLRIGVIIFDLHPQNVYLYVKACTELKKLNVLLSTQFQAKTKTAQQLQQLQPPPSISNLNYDVTSIRQRQRQESVRRQHCNVGEFVTKTHCFVVVASESCGCTVWILLRSAATLRTRRELFGSKLKRSFAAMNEHMVPMWSPRNIVIFEFILTPGVDSLPVNVGYRTREFASTVQI